MLEDTTEALSSPATSIKNVQPYVESVFDKPGRSDFVKLMNCQRQNFKANMKHDTMDLTEREAYPKDFVNQVNR